jgi:serine phosphatase RsbU (regulator of sigma subunit)
MYGSDHTVKLLFMDRVIELVNAAQELSLARNIETVQKIVRSVARKLTGSDGATFILREGNMCFYADEEAILPLFKGSRYPIEICLGGIAMITREPVIIEDVYNDERVPVVLYEPTFVKSLAIVPVRRIDPIAAIGTYWARNHVPDQSDMFFLQAIADVIAVTMENIRVYAELEERVKERTRELEQRNKEITESIIYARRLQRAILPSADFMKSYLPEHFVFYKPLSIVAGDFYWMEIVEVNGSPRILVAACDSTGHGVPGAIISVICSNALNRAVKEFNLISPSAILNKTRELVVQTFARSEDLVSDGMDVSFCSIDPLTCEVIWSGANNKLWYVQDGEIKEIKAHKQSIGSYSNSTPFPEHHLKLKKGDSIYLFTDGFADQFGGPDGKRFRSQQFLDKLSAILQLPMQEQIVHLTQTIEMWQGELDQVDDMLIIGIRI